MANSTESQSGSIANYSMLVRESHLDTFGHMNNATYFEILEEARWQLISERGYDLAHVQKTKQGPVIVEANIKFLKELRLRETINIETQLMEYKGKIGKIRQSIFKEDGSHAAEVVFVFGLFDLKERKLIEPTEAWLHAIGAQSSSH